jgi:hypothetical protein
MFKGQPKEFFELSGVEETHHQLFGQMKGVQETKPPSSLSLNEYDAQEIEYRALRWQIQYATDHKMSETTISTLRKRLDKAQEVRLQQKGIQLP